jgi:hypothetical protein
MSSTRSILAALLCIATAGISDSNAASIPRPAPLTTDYVVPVQTTPQEQTTLQEQTTPQEQTTLQEQTTPKVAPKVKKRCGPGDQCSDKTNKEPVVH